MGNHPVSYGSMQLLRIYPLLLYRSSETSSRSSYSSNTFPFPRITHKSSSSATHLIPMNACEIALDLLMEPDSSMYLREIPHVFIWGNSSCEYQFPMWVQRSGTICIGKSNAMQFLSSCGSWELRYMQCICM